jgi:hypothetical protein
MGLWSRTYVCCAVPLCKHGTSRLARCGRLADLGSVTQPLATCFAAHTDNGGIYAILAQFLIVSLVTGVLCFAAPSSTSSLPAALGARLCLLTDARVHDVQSSRSSLRALSRTSSAYSASPSQRANPSASSASTANDRASSKDCEYRARDSSCSERWGH